MIRTPSFDHRIDTTSRLAPPRDLLGRQPLARLLAQQLLLPERQVVGVFGSWGSGKSFVLDLTIDELFAGSFDYQPIVCLFRPWEYEPDTSLAPGLIQTLQEVGTQFLANPALDPLAAEQIRKAGVDLLRLVRSAVGWVRAVADVAASGLARLPGDALPHAAAARGAATAVSVVADLMDASLSPPAAEGGKPRDVASWNRDEIKNEMRRLISTMREEAARANGSDPDRYRVVVVIDDLDRCAPDLMVDMLNWLKVHLTVDGCSYLLALDHGAAARAIIGRYSAYLGDSAEVTYGLRYLEKIVDFEVELGESALVEEMAVRTAVVDRVQAHQAAHDGAGGADWSRVRSVVDIVERVIGRQGVRSEQIAKLIKLSTLSSPRTMLKVIYRFYLAFEVVRRREEERIRRQDPVEQLPDDYPFWLLLLVAMYYRLAFEDIEKFCHGGGPLLGQEAGDRSQGSRAPEALAEFREFLRPIAGDSGGQAAQPSPRVLMELYSAVRQLST